MMDAARNVGFAALITGGTLATGIALMVGYFELHRWLYRHRRNRLQRDPAAQPWPTQGEWNAALFEAEVLDDLDRLPMTHETL